jgi:hypothetical protein
MRGVNRSSQGGLAFTANTAKPPLKEIILIKWERFFCAGVMAFNAAHCVDPAIQKRGVDGLDRQPASSRGTPDAGGSGLPGGPPMKLEL